MAVQEGTVIHVTMYPCMDNCAWSIVVSSSYEPLKDKMANMIFWNFSVKTIAFYAYLV